MFILRYTTYLKAYHTFGRRFGRCRLEQYELVGQHLPDSSSACYQIPLGRLLHNPRTSFGSSIHSVDTCVGSVSYLSVRTGRVSHNLEWFFIPSVSRYLVGEQTISSSARDALLYGISSSQAHRPVQSLDIYKILLILIQYGGQLVHCWSQSFLSGYSGCYSPLPV